MGRSYRRVIWASVGSIILFGLLGLSASGWLLYSRVQQALSLTAEVQQRTARDGLRGGCGELPAAARAWASAAVVSRPLAPLLQRAGWVPGLGDDLHALPDLVDLADHGMAAGTSACQLLGPALAAASGQERVLRAAQALRDDPQALATIKAHLQQMQTAYSAAIPFVDRSPRLAPYRPSLLALGAQLSTARTAAEQLERAGPQLPWLLGLEAPRRFLLVIQNPFELRPTGGFIGLVCVLRVADAQPTIERCQSSESYTAAATDLAAPFAYSRYLRLGGYYLRDANWSPDFPTAAQTLHTFWRLNGQPALDGVIAADPYVLTHLLRATGPLLLEDGTTIDAEQIVDATLARYYDGAIFRDKQGLAALLPALLQHILRAEPSRMPALAQAVRTSLEQRHLLVTLRQPDLAALLTEQGWDGAVRPTAGDVLRVVDADVGYGAVNGFIERLTHYDVLLDSAGAPLTATLTLTYTNTYSPWAEAATPYAVFGQCLNVASQQIERQPGCYADYLRVLVPRGSRLLASVGIAEPLGVDHAFDRQVFGGYFRVDPGQQHVVQLRYRLPLGLAPTLTLEKQPGTPDLPVLVTMQRSTQRASYYLASSADQRVSYRAADGQPPLDSAAQGAVAAFADHAAFVEGLQHWQAGRRSAALSSWGAGHRLDLAIDYARTLPPLAALALLEALTPAAPDGRVAYERASIYAAQGDAEQAQALYQQAAALSPQHPLAQLTWAGYRSAAGQASPALVGIAPTGSAVRRWRIAADELEQSGRVEEAAAHLAVLVQIMPHDRDLALRYADLLLGSGRQPQAAASYARIAGSDIYGRLAAARLAQIAADPSSAVSQYQAALPLVTTYDQAFRIGDGLRDLGDMAGALESYTRAAELAPGSIWPLLAAGTMLRSSDPAAARAWYARAQQRSPTSGYPDFSLGTLYLAQGDPAAARPLLEAAVAKQPEVRQFREALAQLEPSASPLVPTTSGSSP